MNRLNTTLLILCLILLGATAWLLYERLQSPARAQAQSIPRTQTTAAPELADYMGTLQRYHHKFLLAVQARNTPAAEFYMHELMAQSQVIQEEVATYEGMRIGPLVNTILTPELDSLSRVLDGGEWSAIEAQTEVMTQACNDCHQSTGFGFIQIEPMRVSNPFNQRFDQPAQ